MTDDQSKPPVEVDKPPKAATPKKRGGGGGLVLLALLLGFGGIAGSVYNWLQNQQPETQPEVDAAPREHSHDDLETQLTNIQQAVTEASAGLAALRRELENSNRRFSDIDALSARLQSTEQSLESLQGVSESARQTWVLSEALYYLQAANTRLSLTGDVVTALAAMKAADDRLAALGDPALFRVRGQIADEILSLESVKQPDISGMAIQLASLSNAIAQLPFKNPIPESDQDETTTETEDASGFDRAVAKVVESVSGLVKIDETDAVITPILSQRERSFVVSNISLQIQAARLALLQGKQGDYQAGLKTAREWVDTHFDTDNLAVTNTLGKLSELESVVIRPPLPDISGSLNALKNLRGSS